MPEDSDLNKAERDIRRATLLKNKAESGAELTEDDVNNLYNLVEKEYDSWGVTHSALDALNAIAKANPSLLTGILPHLIQDHLSLPPAYDDGFAFEDVSTDSEIGRPVYASWILHHVAEQDPSLLSAHTDTLIRLYRSDTAQSHYFLLTLGHLVVADPNGLPVDSIRTDLQELLDRGDWYATETERILTQLE